MIQNTSRLLPSKGREGSTLLKEGVIWAHKKNCEVLEEHFLKVKIIVPLGGIRGVFFKLVEIAVYALILVKNGPPGKLLK